MIIGLQVRHYKAYKNMNFIPLGHEHNFVAFSGENGAGKSSILEALDTFLNNKNWFLTKDTKRSESYIAPLFLIPKNKVTRLEKEFSMISNFFWSLEEKEKKSQFFEIRKSLNSNKRDSHYLVFLGENYDKSLYVPFGKGTEDALLSLLGETFSAKTLLKELKDIYSYVYIPVEIDSESFTKIETKEMQKIFNKQVVDEIKKSLRTRDIQNINTNLDSFVSNLEKKLEGEYYYDTGDERQKNLTQKSLVDTVLEIYFKKRVLMKGNRSNIKLSKKMSELSAGEKRESLINLVYVFLKEADERDSIIIIGIDEPENSLHTAFCYEQFEKLKKVSKNAQVFITTHWYGFLPIIDKGLVHFLRTESRDTYKGTEEVINFYHKVDLFQYPFKTTNIPKDFTLKSTNDLVQSIYHSLNAVNEYNWLICEGPSDQIYLKYFLEDEEENINLKIIPVGGLELVKKFYKYLALPISENLEKTDKGKVFCLTDTDCNMRKSDIKQDPKLKESLILKRFATGENNTSIFIKFEEEQKQSPINIEQSLNPIIFKKTIGALKLDEKYSIIESNIQNPHGNTTQNNLRNFEIENLFSTIPDLKIKFAKKYVKLMNEEGSPENYIPDWIKEIKSFYNP